ncbi:MAG: TatD family hydrolase [Synergistaceae bacterium]|nr:TatD family hydrolase [Synergistaceae bacterium]
MNYLIDSHCHLNSKEFCGSVDYYLDRAEKAGVRQFIIIGADFSNSAEAAELAELYSNRGVYATAGVHPHDAKIVDKSFPEEFLKLLNGNRIVAIGETGLDYYYDHSPREKQKQVFREHINLAKEKDLPIILHIRDAMDDALQILHSEGAPPGGVFHCYAGGLKYLDEALSFGYYISFSGAITFAKSEELREVARIAPIDRILCETDCPWLAPIPFRGKLNEPANVKYVYETIAAARNISMDYLAEKVKRNNFTVFPRLQEAEKNV